jgi:hypothetical protein
MKLIKNTNHGKVKILKIIFFFYFCLFSLASSSEILSKKKNVEKFVQIKILDKVSSKNTQLELNIGKEKKFQNLLIKVLKCRNSKFDDNPEITAYLQVKDLSNKTNDEVFVFNGWTFSSSPSLRPFDHPVYDIWLIKCY